jgi:transposase
VLTGLAKGVPRRKTDELAMACDGRFTASHAQMCRLHLDACGHLTAKIAELDVLVAGAAAPFQRLIARLVTIPGIGPRTAQVIVAETGGDMTRFAASARLAAWAGLAPGPGWRLGRAGAWAGLAPGPGWPPGPGWRLAASGRRPLPAKATSTSRRR